MLVAAAALLLGVANDSAVAIASSVVASVASLILLWAGVTRSSSRPAQRDMNR